MKNLLLTLALLIGLFLTGCDTTEPVSIDDPTGTFVSDTPVSLSEGQSVGADLVIEVKRENGEIQVSGQYITSQFGPLELDAFNEEFSNPRLYFEFDIIGMNHAVPYRFDGEYSESGNQIRAEITNSNMDFRKVVVFERTN